MLANVMTALVTIQVVAGALNVALLAPVWMQLVHLALAVATWLSVVLLGASAFAVRAEVRQGQPQPADLPLAGRPTP